MTTFTDPIAAFQNMDDAFASFRGLQGIALASHYEVLIFPPSGAFSQSAARNVSLRCESISMPGMNLNTSTDANMYAVQPDIVDGVSFSRTTNMVFTMSQDLRERKFFEQWQGLAWNRSTWNIGYYSDYIGTVEIYMLDNNFTKTFGVKLHECFPKEINGNDLTATPATTAMKLTVQMQYKYWDTQELERKPLEGQVDAS